MLKNDRGSVPYVLRPHRVEDMSLVVRQESAGYAEQYGWDDTFEALVATIVTDFVSNFDPLRERCWIAEVAGKSVGHIFLVKHPSEPDTAKLRLLFVEPSARGMGLGDALVREMCRVCAECGLPEGCTVDAKHSYRGLSHLREGRISVSQGRATPEFWEGPGGADVGVGARLLKGSGRCIRGPAIFAGLPRVSGETALRLVEIVIWWTRRPSR